MRLAIQALAVSFAVSGCVAIQPDVAPYLSYGGSKSDGVVKLGFRHPAGVTTVGDMQQATTLANQLCNGWGYKSAVPFGQTNKSCYRKADQEWIGCVVSEVTQEFECLR